MSVYQSVSKSVFPSVHNPLKVPAALLGGGGSAALPPLDTIPNIISAASMRRLTTSQSSWGVVRRASDSAELELGFSGKWIDAATLLAWAGASDVFVKTLRCAGGVDLTQATNGSQPQLLSAGTIIPIDYAATISFDGVNDMLSSPLAVSWGASVSGLVAIGAISGADKVVFSSGSTTGGAEQNWYAPLTNGSGFGRIGTVDTGPSFDLYDLTANPGRFGAGGVFSPAAVPIYNTTLGASGWSRPFSAAASGAFSATPLRLGGDTRVGFYSTLKTLGFACTTSQLSASEIQTVAKAVGVAASGIVIGDSTIAAYSGTNPVASYMLSPADSLRTFGINSIAVPGHTIAQQKTAWQAVTTRGLAEWVTIQIGLNDCNPSDSTTSAKIAAIQDLVNTIRTDNADCKIVIATMAPAYERWPALSWNQAQAQARWVAMNDAIMGRGASPIIGVDRRVESHTVSLSKDVGGNAALADAYNTGDGIHPNNAGRSIIGSAYRSALGSLGFF